MGLNISAYSNLRALYKNETPEKIASFYKNEDFPGRAAGIVDDAVYTYDECFSFRAGSYTGYNEWRNQLAQLAGYESAEDCWTKTEGPFWELINFTDCEGVLGDETCAKLLIDFRNYLSAVQTTDWFSELYMQWMKAMELASNYGAVKFS